MLIKGFAIFVVGLGSEICTIPVSPAPQPALAGLAFTQDVRVLDAGAKPKSQPEENEGERTQAVEPPPDRFVWRQRPSFRFGNVFRVDFSAMLHEDIHRSYAGAEVLLVD